MQGHTDVKHAAIIGDMVERGMALATGRAGRVDLVEAHKWFNLAAVSGDRSAARRREEIAREMSRDEVQEALRAARAWLARH
jgi:TPR repeat protein